MGAPKWRPGKEKNCQPSLQAERGCVLGAPAAARWTVMWQCMLSKERGNMSMESRLQAVGVLANTMKLKIQRARNGGRLTG